MLDPRALLSKLEAAARRRLSAARNALYGRLGVWPVQSMTDHWIADLPIYCISLARAAERRAVMMAQVQRMGLRRFELVDAVDARDLTLPAVSRDGRYDPAACHALHGRDLTLNEIACSLSHAAVYTRIVSRGHPSALVLEDDALFHTRRLARFRLEDVPAGTDLVFFNAILDRTPPRDPIGRHLYRDTSYAGSSAAYLLTLEAARKLSAASLPVIHAADGLLGRALSVAPGQEHPFRQRGSAITLSAVIVHPEPVTNGSIERFHVSAIRTTNGP